VHLGTSGGQPDTFARSGSHIVDYVRYPVLPAPSPATLETSCEFTRDRSLGGLHDSLGLLLLLSLKLFGDYRLLNIHIVDNFYLASW
jgi:hypothetical protein